MNTKRSAVYGPKREPPERLTAGQLARRARVNRATVRYYERRRLLASPPRSLSGYRLFSGEALRRLRFIRRAKNLGFSLNEIRELLALRVDSTETCDRVRDRARAKLADVEARIEVLERMRDALRGLLGACAKRRRTGECPILRSLEACDEA